MDIVMALVLGGSPLAVVYKALNKITGKISTDDESQERLHTDDWHDYAILYSAVVEYDTDELVQLMSAIPSLEKRTRLVLLRPPLVLRPPLDSMCKLSSSRGLEGYWTSRQHFKTVLQRAAASSARHVEVIIDNIDIASPNGFQLLKDISEKLGLLHILNDFQSVSLLLRKLSSYEQWVELVLCYRNDIRQLTGSRYMDNILESSESKEKLWLLRDFTGDKRELIEKEPLTPDEIQKLSPYSTQYLIPKDQTNSKPYAIILYNPEDRDGAEDEANKLEQAWKIARHEVIISTWQHTNQIHQLLDDNLERLLGHCSLLTVNIMCHGHRGVLRGSHNSGIRINKILHHLVSATPSHLPMVGFQSSSIASLGLFHDFFSIIKTIYMQTDRNLKLMKCIYKLKWYSACVFRQSWLQFYQINNNQ